MFILDKQYRKVWKLNKSIPHVGKVRKTGGGHRELVLQFLGNTCICCGATENLQVDHVIPIFKGGKNHISNIQCLCTECHKHKTKVDVFDLQEKQSNIEMFKSQGVV